MSLRVANAAGAPAVATRALRGLLASRSPLAARAAGARYTFRYLGAEERSWEEWGYHFSIEPRGDRMRSADGASAETRRPSKVYRVPRGAIAHVPDDRGLVYRGMAWEEWQSIRKRCTVQSRGDYNIDQGGYTFFGRADTAASYATDLWFFAPALTRPGVVIAVPRALVLSHDEDPRMIPPGEYAAKGPLPAGAIRGVWLLVPRRVAFGEIEVVVSRGRLVGEGRWKSPTVWYAVLGHAAKDLRCPGARR